MALVSAWYILPAAFALDIIGGDPHWLPHPVRWMGRAIEACEPYFRKRPLKLTIAGTLFSLFLIAGTWTITLVVVKVATALHHLVGTGVEIILIYFCLSARSLADAAMAVAQRLLRGQLPEARAQVALIVGRDVEKYEADGIARATVETVAENLVDGVISPLFFAALGGAPLAMAYKMVNTLDSMVGYKNDRYIDFGKASARIDDVFNYIPARLAVPVIALATQILAGQGGRSLKTAWAEGANHSSPNAGYPEAAFAGALAVKLNGPNYYGGRLVDKPYIGIRFGPAHPNHIKKACDIMLLAALIGVGLVSTQTVLFGFF
ncbi:MAG: cobalamin biosynthesis protein CobD [Desulfobacterales bacterium]|nr:MAG: cobalamin biosynthesis protein CobD [Desulfobacterales bacterium]